MDEKKKFIQDVRKQEREYKKWENSLEGILYNLSTWADATQQDEKNKIIIAKTLQRLPKRIREKVLSEVVFMSMTACGTLVKFRYSKIVRKEEFREIGGAYAVAMETVVIFLNFHNKHSEKYHMDTVAHEVAHFILGDYTGNFPEPKHPKGYNAENAADDLAEKWGFRRAYKSYDRFKNV